MSNVTSQARDSNNRGTTVMKGNGSVSRRSLTARRHTHIMTKQHTRTLLTSLIIRQPRADTQRAIFVNTKDVVQLNVGIANNSFQQFNIL